MNIFFDGVNYDLDAAKLAEIITELKSAFEELSTKE